MDKQLVEASVKILICPIRHSGFPQRSKHQYRMAALKWPSILHEYKSIYQHQSVGGVTSILARTWDTFVIFCSRKLVQPEQKGDAWMSDSHPSRGTRLTFRDQVTGMLCLASGFHSKPTRRHNHLQFASEETEVQWGSFPEDTVQGSSSAAHYRTAI